MNERAHLKGSDGGNGAVHNVALGLGVFKYCMLHFRCAATKFPVR